MVKFVFPGRSNVSKQPLLREGIWFALGSILTGAALLVSSRILTSVVSPAVYGAVGILLAIVTFGRQLLVDPVLTASKRYYPQALVDGTESETQDILRHILKVGIGIATFISIIGFILLNRFSISTVITVPALVAVLSLMILTAWRGFESSLVTSARRQRTYATWLASEAWAKLLGAVGLVLFVSATTESIIVGYAIGIAAVLVIFYPRREIAPIVERHNTSRGEQVIGLKSDIVKYLWPLIPVGVVSWIMLYSDRILLGWLSSPAEAGVYFATYSLISFPVMAIGGILSGTFSPVLFSARAKQDSRHEQRIRSRWLVVTILASAIICALVYYMSEIIVNIFLGPEFRSGANLMVWIAIGYGFFNVELIFEAVLHAQKRTKAILLALVIGASVNLAVNVLLIPKIGMLGASIATMLAFGFQLLASILLTTLR